MRVKIIVDDEPPMVAEFAEEEMARGGVGFRWHPGLQCFVLWEWHEDWPAHQWGTIGTPENPVVA